ncbi:hypothetical protein KIPB_005430 [Kipferlia bialata]|uniref:Uncharacterized protein n=1 Tax=Kipferlia bialata TaxID=797122 RepID=A0A9K3GI73_9EUKA|nr:hypothetical protein KIPB_005430 [Kipferlia bialata]|eukprot:g5430.t1
MSSAVIDKPNRATVASVQVVMEKLVREMDLGDFAADENIMRFAASVMLDVKTSATMLAQARFSAAIAPFLIAWNVAHSQLEAEEIATSLFNSTREQVPDLANTTVTTGAPKQLTTSVQANAIAEIRSETRKKWIEAQESSHIELKRQEQETKKADERRQALLRRRARRGKLVMQP